MHESVTIRAHGKSELCQARRLRAFDQARERQARDRARLFARLQGSKGGVVW
jgi:hypothetical protein